MKKICFVAQFPPPIHGLSIATQTLYDGIDITEYSLEKINLVNNKIFIINCIRIIKSKAELFYFTISQSKMGNFRDLFLLWLIRLKRKKCVIHLHGGYFRKLFDEEMSSWQKKQNVKALSKIDRAIVLSGVFKNIFEGLVPEEKITVVPNFADVREINANCSRNTKKVKNILYLSNMIESKGYREVLKLALLEKTNSRGYHFDFAGVFFDEVEKDFFNTFIDDNKLQTIVSYHGIVKGETKDKLLEKSDIFVLLTRYSKEGQPISIIEAMANGLAVVATDHAAIPDMIKDGENGILVDEHCSLENIYEKIQELDLDKIYKVNRDAARELYSKEQYIGNMEKIFNEVYNHI